ncbi:hypothetical protein UlMin_010346 [Ulmus minor]
MANEPFAVQIIRREKIKPSSPTPHHLKTFKLSLLDQMTPDLYIPLSLFYPFSSTELPHLQEATEIAAKRSLHLRKSLSETLTHFYPFAGRIKNNLEIECNDEGAQFIEAQVNCSISEILKQPDSETIKQFLPIETDLKHAVINGCLLVIQVSHFEDGGIALGLSVSHKITDASTLSMLINSWATTCLGSGQSLVPKFGAEFLFPPLSDSKSTSSDIFAAELVEEKCTTRRFVFDAEKIALLRSKSASEIVKNPTRVEAISALIWKCAMQASRSNSGVHRPSVCFQSMNIRPRVAPPLPKNFAGNFVAGYFATNKEEDKIRESDHLQSLVTKFRKGIKEVEEKYAKRDGWKEGMQVLQEYGNLVKNDGIDNYIFTSWCRFSLYESDFGWGKPAWLCNANLVPKNTIILMDTRDGDGIEAWLTLKVEEMALFESNQELLSFAFLNPSVVWN